MTVMIITILRMHTTTSEAAITEAAKYLVIDIRLQISMDMAVKSVLYALIPSGCVFIILRLTWRYSNFQSNVWKIFMFLLGSQ